MSNRKRSDRKLKFIVNRHTWNLDQFEFSVPCSYQECLGRLKLLEEELQTDYDKHANGRGFRPVVKLESDNDASSFELALEGATVTGTILQITDETTLFVGLSQFGGAFYLVVIAIIIMALVIAIISFLSAYVMADPNGIWSVNTVNSALFGVKIAPAGILLFYLLFRWHVWRAVNKLLSPLILVAIKKTSLRRRLTTNISRKRQLPVSRKKYAIT